MNRNLVWIDLEMTGLSVERDAIIEIATIVTTSELDVVAEGRYSRFTRAKNSSP